MTLSRSSPFSFLFFIAAACGPAPDTRDKIDVEGPSWSEAPFTSAEATLVDFDFDGELWTDAADNPYRDIWAQALYMIGQLNGDRSVPRLDKLSVWNIAASDDGGKTHYTYHARVPVAWNKKNQTVQTYRLTLPRDVSDPGQQAFISHYGGGCVDASAHDLDLYSMYYYYRPHASGCRLAAGDVVELTAAVTPSSENTTGKYPEYDRVWSDGALDVVAVFGKYTSGATSSSDAGIAAYNEFVASVKRDLSGFALQTTPAQIPSRPGAAMPDVSFTATRSDGTAVRITALLTDGVADAGEDFYGRYESLTPTADIIFYGGHSGLGRNIRALIHRGKFVAGKYVILFLNGCDSFAYLDGALAASRAALNPDDPTGTRYMDTVTNVMPAYFSRNAGAGLALIRGLLDNAHPVTYEKIFKNVDQKQVVVVTGEEDNTYTP